MKKNILSFAFMLLAAVFVVNRAIAQEVPHVYINPGHGGHDSDDRNVVIPPFAQGDTLGFWESNSNLWKGFALKEILTKKGYQTSISRISNTTADDLALSTIVYLSNHSGADVFYSIHSNASGSGGATLVNFPMGFYRGYTGQPVIPRAADLLGALAPYIIDNSSTVWSSPNYAIYGDWTFRPEWGTQGYGVLRGNNIPAILDEGSFHDYYPEAYRLINHEYCWVEGWSFSLGADAYFGRLDQYGLGMITGTIRDDRVERVDILRMLGADKRLPVNEAEVKLKDADGNVLQTYKCDTIRNGIYLFKYVEPGTYTVEVSHPKYFSQSTQVQVTANAKTYQNFDLKRVRDTPPMVVEYSPRWSEGDDPVLCSAPIVLQFNWDMDTESVEEAFELEPAVEGTIKWEDTNYRLIFTPDDAYDVDTDYKLTLKKTAKHGGGTEMEEDFVLNFRTTSRNHINKLAMFPEEGDQVHYKAGAYVEFRSDSLLNAKDLYTFFHIYDKDGNDVEINKRNIKNNKKGDAYGYIRLSLLKALNPDEQYKVVVDKGVSDTVGIHLAEPLTFNFTAVDASAQTTEANVVEEFESADGFSVAPLEVDGLTASVSANTDKLFGSKSLQLSYTFPDDEENEAVVNVDKTLETTFSSLDKIHLHIMGDMSFNHLNLLFTGESRDVVSVPVADITFHGWRHVSMPLTALPEGDKYQLTGISLVKNETVMGRSGAIRLDNLLVEKPVGVEEVTANSTVKVMPNPASDYVVATADGYITGIELINASGQVLVRNASNYINVSDIPAGVYFVRVYTGEMVTTRKVAVAH